jgi:hypothetical protein
MVLLRLLVPLCIGATCLAAASSSHGVKPVSTDGEATVYLTGAFSRGFALAYNVSLASTPGNRGDTFVGIMLIGRQNPGPGIELGLTRTTSHGQTEQAFLSVKPRRGGSSDTSFPVVCAPVCELVLRGDRYGIYAAVLTQDGIHNVGAWSRDAFGLVRPYVQLNGEVTRPGDRIAAALSPMRTVVDSQVLPAPVCGFTTRGILPRRNPGGTLTFSGTYRIDAPSSFIDLRRGRFVDRCPR